MTTEAKGLLIYICDWLPPDFGAVGQYSVGFARDYAMQGRSVVLIGLSSTEQKDTIEKCGLGQLKIRYLSAIHYNKAQPFRRLSWTLRTNFRLVRAVAREMHNADEILFTGAPPFLLHFVVLGNLLWRRRLVYRITDFHPECLMASLTRVPAGMRLFHRLTCAMRRRVDEFQVLGYDQMRRLQEVGISAERITLKRDPTPVAVSGNENPLITPPEFAGYRVLLYSGNWGIAHEVDTFVEGYIRHHRRGTGRVILWLNAVGSSADRVEAELRAAGAPVVRSQPVPLELLPRLLVTADVHLITLKDAFVGYVMPSKVYGCLASRRPILFIGSELSDVHLLCAQAARGAGYQRVNVGDAMGVMTALERFPARIHSVPEATAA